MGPEQVNKIEQEAFERLLGPSSACALRSQEHILARDFVIEKIQRAISEAFKYRVDEETTDALKIVSIIDDGYVSYLSEIYSAINSNALLSPSQSEFAANLMAVEEEVLNHEVDIWEHAATVATYINSCRG